MAPDITLKSLELAVDSSDRNEIISVRCTLSDNQVSPLFIKPGAQ